MEHNIILSYLTTPLKLLKDINLGTVLLPYFISQLVTMVVIVKPKGRIVTLGEA